MPIVHHRKASALSYPLWFATRALLKPTLAVWPLNRPGLAGLFLIDRLFAGAPEPRHVVREQMELAGRPTEVVMPSGPTRRDADPAIRAKLEGTGEALTRNLTGRYPAAEQLAALLATAPATLPVILVRPPVYRTALPAPGTPDASSETACRDAFGALAAKRPRTALIDWRRDRPELRDPNQFFDHSHYRQPIARLVEADIAAALARLR